jgi:hypothetical protein
MRKSFKQLLNMRTSIKTLSLILVYLSVCSSVTCQQSIIEMGNISIGDMRIYPLSQAFTNGPKPDKTTILYSMRGQRNLAYLESVPFDRINIGSEYVCFDVVSTSENLLLVSCFVKQQDSYYGGYSNRSYKVFIIPEIERNVVNKKTKSFLDGHRIVSEVLTHEGKDFIVSEIKSPGYMADLNFFEVKKDSLEQIFTLSPKLRVHSQIFNKDFKLTQITHNRDAPFLGFLRRFNRFNPESVLIKDTWVYTIGQNNQFVGLDLNKHSFFTEDNKILKLNNANSFYVMDPENGTIKYHRVFFALMTFREFLTSDLHSAEEDANRFFTCKLDLSAEDLESKF